MSLDYASILEQRRYLWQQQEQQIKDEILSIDLKLRNLDPLTEEYRKLQQQKMDLTQKLYSSSKLTSEKILDLEKKVNDEKEKNREAVIGFARKFKAIDKMFSAYEKVKKVKDKTQKGLKLATKVVKGTTNFVLEKALTKKVGGNGMFHIGGKRQGRFQFDGLLKKYSKDFQRLSDDMYIKGQKLFVKGFNDGKAIDANNQVQLYDLVQYLKDKNESEKDIFKALQMLKDSQGDISQKTLDLLKTGFTEVNERLPGELPTNPMLYGNSDLSFAVSQSPSLLSNQTTDQHLIHVSLDDDEREDVFTDQKAKKQAEQIDKLNRKDLEETLKKFYDGALKLQKQSFDKQNKFSLSNSVTKFIPKFGKFFKFTGFMVKIVGALTVIAVAIGPFLKKKFIEWWNNKKAEKMVDEVKKVEGKISSTLDITKDSKGNPISDKALLNINEISEKTGKDKVDILADLEKQVNSEYKETVLGADKTDKDLSSIDIKQNIRNATTELDTFDVDKALEEEKKQAENKENEKGISQQPTEQKPLTLEDASTKMAKQVENTPKPEQATQASEVPFEKQKTQEQQLKALSETKDETKKTGSSARKPSVKPKDGDLKQKQQEDAPIEKDINQVAKDEIDKKQEQLAKVAPPQQKTLISKRDNKSKPFLMTSIDNNLGGAGLNITNIPARG